MLGNHRRSALRIASAAILSAGILGGCVPKPIIEPGQLAAVIAKIDTSALVPAQNVTLPPGAVGWDAIAALDPGGAGPTLTGQPFAPSDTKPGGTIAASADFTYEWRPYRAGAVLLQREGSGRSVPVDGGLRADALAKLHALGIEGQLGAVLLRDQMTQLRQLGEAPGAPQVRAHKVFVERAIAGIPLLDSRAVFTYGTDRSFRKLLVRWRGLANDGHALTSDLTPAQVAEVVARDLISGRDDDAARIFVRWVYEEQPVSPGEARLALRAEATLLGPAGAEEDGGGAGEKIRVRLVDPSRYAATFCDVDTTLERYPHGAAFERVRFANYTGAPFPARLRVELRKPGASVVSLFERSAEVISKYDQDFAADGRLTSAELVAQSQAPGSYEVRCSIENTATGSIVGQDRAIFVVDDTLEDI